MVSRNPAESSCVNDEIEPKDRDGWQSNHAGRINQILSRNFYAFLNLECSFENLRSQSQEIKG